MQLAAQLWEKEGGTAREVQDLLAAHLPAPGREDLRDFAWRYQWALLHQQDLFVSEDGSANVHLRGGVPGVGREMHDHLLG